MSASKPWEETWRFDAQYPKTSGAEVRPPGEGPHTRSAQFGKASGPWGGGGWYEADDHDIARARLASAAPEMARVLLAVEWSGSDEEGSHCPSCYASAYGKPVHDADGRYLHCETGVHEPNCAWVAALRKAGVR